MSMKPRRATCHPARKHKAKGLCGSCYSTSLQKDTKQRATCHPDRAHYANGLCKNCYRSGGIQKAASCHPHRKEFVPDQGICKPCYEKREKRALCHPDRPNNARGLCAECVYAKQKAKPGFSERKREKDRGYRLKSEYGLSYEDWDYLHEQQGFCCKICGDSTKLFVDHDHATGRIRGLLCRECNSGLGKFKDSDILLTRAAEYLNAVGD